MKQKLFKFFALLCLVISATLLSCKQIKNPKMVDGKYVYIPDPLFLKVINKNLDPDRPDNQMVTKKEMESLTVISHWLDKDGKPGYQDDAETLILKDSQKNLKDTKDFKFAISYGIKNIEGIKYAKNVTHIKLNENEIEDISELAELKKLEYLEISRNRIKNINPLKNLTNLKFLKLYNNLIQDISPIKDLVNLEYLDVHYNVKVEGDESNKIISDGITDISPLKDLKNLNYLDICFNRISKGQDVLANLTKLEVIEASDNNLNNIFFLKSLNNIQDFSIARNNVTDYTGLQDIIVPKVLKQLQEECGRMDFAGQINKLKEPIKVKEKTISFQSPYKCLKEILIPIAKSFGMSEEDVKTTTTVTSSLNEVKADYNLDTSNINLVLDESFFNKNKGKALLLKLDINLLYMFNWTLNLVVEITDV